MSDLEVRNMLLHKWTTAGRPSTTEARIGYNTTLDVPEWNDGSQFVPVLIPRTAALIADGGYAGSNQMRNATDVYGAALAAMASILPEKAVLRATEDASSATGVSAAWSGVFEGFLHGGSFWALGFPEDFPLKVGLTGKATAAAIDITDTSTGATFNIDVTSLSVAASDIALTSGQLLVGNGSNIAQATAQSSLPISGWGKAQADIDLDSWKLVNVASPTADHHAANRGWVLSVISSSGVAPKSPVRVSTTTTLPAFTSTGTNVLTANASGAFPATDGVTLILNDTVLVRYETGANEKYNGAYQITTLGDGSNPWVLTRTTDSDTSAEVVTGIEYFVLEGTLYAGSTWGLATTGTITLNTTSLAFVQTASAIAYLAGNGIIKSGTTFHFGQSAAYTANTIPYASGSASIGFIGAGTANQVIRVGGGGGAPAFGQLDISQSAAVTGVLDEVNGGTGQSMYAIGDLLQASGTAVLSRLAAVATGSVLLSGGLNTVSAWGKVGLTTHVSGQLTVPNGGTGKLSLTTNAILLGNGSGAINDTTLSTGDAGALLVTASGGVPQLVIPSGAGDVTIATTGTMTVGANKITHAKLAQVTGPIVLGRQSGTGDVQSLSDATLKTMLGLTGTNSGDQTITLTGDVTGSGTGSFAVEIAAGAVGATELATNSVTTAKITDLNVTAGKLAADSVETAKILNLAVTTAKLAEDAVSTTKILNSSVTTDKILNLAVTTGKLNDGAVTAAKLNADAVETLKILNLAVTEAKIANNAVGNAKLRASAGWSLIGRSASGSGDVADITGTLAGQVPRIGGDNILAFGALNLASANAVTGTLPTSLGGTGTSVTNLFPTVAGGTQIAGIAKYGLASGSSSYNISNPFGNTDVIVQVFNASGTQIFPDISRTTTNVVVAFGQTTAVSYRVIITGNNLS